MAMHIQRIVVVPFLLAAAAGWAQESKDEALEVYAIGGEQQILDSLEASTPDVPVPSGPTIIDSAYAAVLAKAYPIDLSIDEVKVTWCHNLSPTCSKNERKRDG
jgi:hypothetical protein